MDPEQWIVYGLSNLFLNDDHSDGKLLLEESVFTQSEDEWEDKICSI